LRNVEKEDKNPKLPIKTAIATFLSIDSMDYYDVTINWTMML